MNGKTLKLRINGREYPCRMTMGALLRFKRETGMDVSRLASDDLSNMIVFVWCCVAGACNADCVEFSMDLIDFADALEPDSLNEFFTGLIAGQKKRQVTQNKKE